MRGQLAGYKTGLGRSRRVGPRPHLNIPPMAVPPGCAYDMCHGNGREPNQFDACLDQDVTIWYNISCLGGITSLCRRAESVRYADDEPPWVKMPQQGKRFQEIFSIPLAAFALGVDTPVLTFRVPVGYDGVIIGNVNRFIGAGFAEGSGDIEWRIQLSRRYARDFGQILTSEGDLQALTAFQGGGIRIYSNQIIRYLARVNNFALLDPNGRILTCLWGWFYPRP
jgi:hypothetical protein